MALHHRTIKYENITFILRLFLQCSMFHNIFHPWYRLARKCWYTFRLEYIFVSVFNFPVIPYFNLFFPLAATYFRNLDITKLYICGDVWLNIAKATMVLRFEKLSTALLLGAHYCIKYEIGQQILFRLCACVYYFIFFFLLFCCCVPSYTLRLASRSCHACVNR